MAGSPKKRARREAERLRRAAAHAEATPPQPAATQDGVDKAAPSTLLPAPTPLKGEILPPIKDEEVTRTALKRAMRKRAQEMATRAIDTLEKNLDSLDPEIRGKAANDILKWGFGNPATEIEAGDGSGLSIAIVRFGETPA